MILSFEDVLYSTYGVVLDEHHFRLELLYLLGKLLTEHAHVPIVGESGIEARRGTTHIAVFLKVTIFQQAT